MTKLTRAQLEAQLEAAHVSYQALGAKYHMAVEALAQVRADNAALQQNVISRRPVRHPEYTRATPTVAQQLTHEAYTRALIAAREMAARTGRAVRVGSMD